MAKKDKGMKPVDIIIKTLILAGLGTFLLITFCFKAVFYIFSKGSIMDDTFIAKILQKMKGVFKKWE